MGEVSARAEGGGSGPTHHVAAAERRKAAGGWPKPQPSCDLLEHPPARPPSRLATVLVCRLLQVTGMLPLGAVVQAARGASPPCGRGCVGCVCLEKVQEAGNNSKSVYVKGVKS
jgi:hypothetical protein